jgi:hypothetical protein
MLLLNLYSVVYLVRYCPSYFLLAIYLVNRLVSYLVNRLVSYLVNRLVSYFITCFDSNLFN